MLNENRGCPCFISLLSCSANSCTSTGTLQSTHITSQPAGLPAAGHLGLMAEADQDYERFDVDNDYEGKLKLLQRIKSPESYGNQI